MTNLYKSKCEFDLGLDGHIYTSIEALEADQKAALRQMDCDESFDELDEGGLIGHEEVTVVGGDITADQITYDGLDLFDHLRAANRARQEVWPGGDKADGPFRTIEFGEEAGELLGAVKKLMRFQRGIAGNVGKSEADLIQSVREEIGDVLISLDLMVDFLDIDLRECVPMKFNMTSAKVGVNCYMDNNWGWGTLDDEVQDELFPR